MYIYAKQIPPESILPVDPFEDDMNDHVAVFGNPCFKSHIPSFIGKIIEFITEEEPIFEIINNDTVAGTFSEHIAGTDAAKEYVDGYAEKLAQFLTAYDQSELNEKSVNDITCEILAVITEFNEWKHTTIRGSCQSEWQEIIYPTGLYTSEAIQNLSQMYWNECDQWLTIVTDEKITIDPETADEHTIWDDADAMLVNTFGWNDESIAEEIKNETGSETDSVILLKFTGYKRVPLYACEQIPVNPVS